MPTIRKLTPAELQAIRNKGKSRRTLIEELYDSFIADFDIGDYGEAELTTDEKRPTVRKHLKAAAQRYGVALEFSRLCCVVRIKSGSGLHCAEKHAKWWSMRLVIAARKPAASSGMRSRPPIAKVPATVGCVSSDYPGYPAYSSRQGERRNRTRGALEQYLAAAMRPLCPQDTVLFKIGDHAWNRFTPVLASLQFGDCYPPRLNHYPVHLSCYPI